MLFNSFSFVIFFPAVLAVFFATPVRYRWAVLLVASYVFYGWWKPAYLGLIATSTVIDFAVAQLILRSRSPRRQRRLLAISIVSNLGLLGVFKYLGFLGDTADWLAGAAGFELSYAAAALTLPVGISFYTFQTLSYTVDVARGEQRPVGHLGKFALFVAFFPQLVAGPIERASKLMPQLDDLGARFEYPRVRAGLQLILWGLWKKIVVADNFAPIADRAFTDLGAASSAEVALGTLAFAVQIYCDFSGYSDIAVGSAQCVGVELSDNFRSPYFARSVREFWSRWHITLSTWFRDYVYIPLGGNRSRPRRWAVNIMVTFLLSGLWHGASWTFVVWGGIHGLLLLAERCLPSLPSGTRGRLIVRQVISTLATFVAVSVAWIFFRAPDVGDAWIAVTKLASIDSAIFAESRLELITLALSAIVVTHCFQDIRVVLAELPKPGRWCIYLVLVITLIRFGSYQKVPFIYFQF